MIFIEQSQINFLIFIFKSVIKPKGFHPPSADESPYSPVYSKPSSLVLSLFPHSSSANSPPKTPFNPSYIARNPYQEIQGVLRVALVDLNESFG